MTPSVSQTLVSRSASEVMRFSALRLFQHPLQPRATYFVTMYPIAPTSTQQAQWSAEPETATGTSPKGAIYIPAWGGSIQRASFCSLNAVAPGTNPTSGQALKARYISFALARYTGLSALDFFAGHSTLPPAPNCLSSLCWWKVNDISFSPGPFVGSRKKARYSLANRADSRAHCDEAFLSSEHRDVTFEAVTRPPQKVLAISLQQVQC